MPRGPPPCLAAPPRWSVRSEFVWPSALNLRSAPSQRYETRHEIEDEDDDNERERSRPRAGEVGLWRDSGCLVLEVRENREFHHPAFERVPVRGRDHPGRDQKRRRLAYYACDCEHDAGDDSSQGCRENDAHDRLTLRHPKRVRSLPEAVRNNPQHLLGCPDDDR